MMSTDITVSGNKAIRRIIRQDLHETATIKWQRIHTWVNWEVDHWLRHCRRLTTTRFEQPTESCSAKKPFRFRHLLLSDIEETLLTLQARLSTTFNRISVGDLKGQYCQYCWLERTITSTNSCPCGSSSSVFL